jgi:hypothetical protein
VVPVGASADRALDGGVGGDGGRVDDLLRRAIQLSVEARDYERAAALLELVRGTVPEPATADVVSLARKRGGS